MHPAIKQEIRSKKEWIKLKDGVEIAEFEYQLPDWKKPNLDMPAEQI